MNGRVIDFLLRRTTRERVLLGVLVAVCLPLLITFAVVAPLLEQQNRVNTAYSEAIALNAWVNERVTELGSYASAPEITEHPPIGSSGLEQSLIAAKLRDQISDLSVRDAGIIELRFDEVTFTALADWISTQQENWGYDISSFRFEATEIEGKVSASLALTPQI